MATYDPWTDPLGLNGILPGDWSDSAKMENAAFKTDASIPWWQDLIQYGAKKAIDNAYGTQVQVQGNTDPGSFAGANGLTYAQDYAKRGTNTAASAASAGLFGGGGGGVLLLAALVVGVVLLAKD